MKATQMAKIIPLQICSNCKRPANRIEPLICEGSPSRGEPPHMLMAEVCEHCVDREIARLGCRPATKEAT
jgi:hypothetical protein